MTSDSIRASPSMKSSVVSHVQQLSTWRQRIGWRCEPSESQTPIADAYDVTRYGYIAEVAVDPGHRGRGVGHRLIDAYFAYCRERRLPDVLVRTNEADQHLHRFYAANGFKKLNIAARQDIGTPECSFVTRRYFHRSLR